MIRLYENSTERCPYSEWPLFKKYNFEETEIPAKYRERMGLAAAANIKCPYCKLFHKGRQK